MILQLPEPGLVLLIGASGSGKSTFAARHFLPTEVVSSDRCRGLVCDNENDQAATPLAFELVETLVGLRLRNRKMAVVDATNLRPEDRKNLKRVARDHDSLVSAILFDTPRDVCIARNALRPDRNMDARVIVRHVSMFNKACREVKAERYHRIYRLSAERLENARVERTPLWNDRRDLSGPFDIIGDLHGCGFELAVLLHQLGYGPEGHPDGRTAIFLGDLTDRGPRNLDCYERVRAMVARGQALCIAGNHDAKLIRYLEGRNVSISHGLEKTVAELDQKDESYRQTMKRFLDGLISHYVLDGGRLVVAHAGIKEDYQGRASNRVRQFCLYGDTTGEVDEFGLPVRLDWAMDYRGQAMVVYGHTPVPQANWLNRTINIDTGCVFGGRLTALRYPELELVDVPAAELYCEPARPLYPPVAARESDDLKLDDVSGKLHLDTRLLPMIGIPAAQSAAALEAISRFAVAPEWLVYLPPTMSPSATSEREGFLEYPQEAFEYYSSRGQQRLICQEKHMGSRAVLVLRQDGQGRCYTRTGRPFFEPELEAALVAQLVGTLSRLGFWQELDTDWVCIDAELMPWSAKAQALLRHQYAAVGAASTHALEAAVELLEHGGDKTAELLRRQQARLSDARGFREAYGEYCWSTQGLSGLKLAPFHLLATRGHVYSDRTHRWHLDQLHRWLGQAPCFHPTRSFEVDLLDPDSQTSACAWWEELTAAGGEGMVVKPETFLAFERRGAVLQPAMKVRGREYLRLIYGPEYTEQLPELRRRGLSRKRSLALREFALGLHALETYASGGPLYEVHRAVFGVLALESSPVDPRL
jgi:protein phosphatase